MLQELLKTTDRVVQVGLAGGWHCSHIVVGLIMLAMHSLLGMRGRPARDAFCRPMPRFRLPSSPPPHRLPCCAPLLPRRRLTLLSMG